MGRSARSWCAWNSLQVNAFGILVNFGEYPKMTGVDIRHGRKHGMVFPLVSLLSAALKSRLIGSASACRKLLRMLVSDAISILLFTSCSEYATIFTTIWARFHQLICC